MKVAMQHKKEPTTSCLAVSGRILAEADLPASNAVASVPNQVSGSKKMKHSNRAQDASKDNSGQCDCLRQMISDLDRLIRLLDCDIATEEERSRVFDPVDPAYSILARTLTTRRDNLKNTITLLEQRLARLLSGSLDKVQNAA
jgi:hypothetical protein